MFINLSLVSCNNTQEAIITTITDENTNEITADNSNRKDSLDKEINEHLLLRIESLEKEIDLIKETLQVETSPMDNYSTIINALENDNGDNIIIHIERNDGYLNEVHVKIPKPEYFGYDYCLLTGYEKDGVRIFNRLIKPIHDISDNPQKRDIDLEKYDLVKLVLSDIKFDEYSIALIIIKDSNGKEYSDFIYSDKFMEGEV